MPTRPPKPPEKREPRNPHGREGDPVSLHPLSFEDVLSGILKTPPVANDALKADKAERTKKPAPPGAKVLRHRSGRGES